MTLHSPALSALTGFGVATFVVVVLLLHLAQPGYDPLAQFMSELALGRFGGFLVIAFLGLSVATAATAANLRRHNPPVFLALLLGLAAACFVVAGLITLGTSAQIHVLFVAGAFVTCGVSMYLLPRSVAVFARPRFYIASWGACLVMCAATGLGGNLVLPGVAQRISALALLFWLSFVAWRLAQCTREQAGVPSAAQSLNYES